jgi:tRNA (cmo5U34)-methyltransferase
MDNTTPHASNEYDGQVLKTIPYYRAIHQETINLIRVIKPECRFWLDTGCGTGSLVDQAYEAFPKAEFYVCDPSVPMLGQAKERLAGKSRVAFLGAAPTEKISGDMPEFQVITRLTII